VRGGRKKKKKKLAMQKDGERTHKVPERRAQN
jgi:hypothetical protein